MKTWLCRFASHHLVFLGLALSLLAANNAGSQPRDYADRNVEVGDRDYPEQNSSPRKFILVHGTIDSSLGLTFGIRWEATNKDCQYWLSRAAGAAGLYVAVDLIRAEHEGDNFSLKVPVDGVLAGRCGWIFGGLFVGTKELGFQSLIQTNTDPTSLGPSPNGVVKLRCDIGTRDSPRVTKELQCHINGPDNLNTSVLDGVLWWRPNTTDVEIHIIRGTCKRRWCTDKD